MKLEEAIEVVDRHAIEMLDRENAGIELVAVGTREDRPLNQATEFCVSAFVKEKLEPDEVKDRGALAFSETFAAATGRDPDPAAIQVVECGSAFEPHVGLTVPTPHRGRYGGPSPVCDSQKWFGALRCGIGITNATNEYPSGLSVGTAGFYMHDDDAHSYLVSNNHVIGRSNDASVGEIVVQPGTLDLTAIELRRLATRADLESALGVAAVTALVPLRFKTPTNVPINHVDAAIARLQASSGRRHTDLDRLTFAGGISGVGAAFTPGAGSVRVHKVGRTTGFTEGEVIGVNGTASIPYPGGTAYFAQQIVIRPTSDNLGPFSRPGDSGSGILNDRNELSGLLFAGSQDQTLANPIGRVIDGLRTASGTASLQVATT